MEEMVATDAMKAEILEDARKKAEHILKEADEASARELEEGRALAARLSEKLARESAGRIARRRAEADARLPLDRMRARIAFVDRALREATRAYVSALPEAEVSRLAASMIAAASPFFAGKRTRATRRGLSAAAASSAAASLGSGVEMASEEDASLTAAGVAIATIDGDATLSATMDLVEERLLDLRREELAKALCAEALSL